MYNSAVLQKISTLKATSYVYQETNIYLCSRLNSVVNKLIGLTVNETELFPTLNYFCLLITLIHKTAVGKNTQLLGRNNSMTRKCMCTPLHTDLIILLLESEVILDRKYEVGTTKSCSTFWLISILFIKTSSCVVHFNSNKVYR